MDDGGLAAAPGGVRYEAINANGRKRCGAEVKRIYGVMFIGSKGKPMHIFTAGAAWSCPLAAQSHGKPKNAPARQTTRDEPATRLRKCTVVVALQYAAALEVMRSASCPGARQDSHDAEKMQITNISTANELWAELRQGEADVRNGEQENGRNFGAKPNVPISSLSCGDPSATCRTSADRDAGARRRPLRCTCYTDEASRSQRVGQQPNCASPPMIRPADVPHAAEDVAARERLDCSDPIARPIKGMILPMPRRRCGAGLTFDPELHPAIHGVGVSFAPVQLEDVRSVDEHARTGL